MRLSAIGDICHTLPIIHTLQHYWPHTRITWITGKTEYSLVKGLPNVNFIIFDKSQGLAAYNELRRQLKGKEFELLLHLQESLRASLATLFISASVKLGYNKKDCQDLQWLFTNKRITYQPRIHYMDRMLLFTKALHLTPPIVEWNIPLSAEDSATALALLPKDRPFVVISPCSSIVKHNYRNWTPDGYSEIAHRIERELNHAVVITGGNSEQEKKYARHIELNAQVPTTNLVGQLNLKQLCIVLKNASAVISPDSGPAHMANAVGTPAVGLFYSSNPDFTGPYNNRDWVVNRYPEALEKYNKTSVEKAPWGMRVRTPEAAELITVRDVMQKLQKLQKFTDSSNPDNA